MSVFGTEITLINEGDAVLADKGHIREDEIRKMTVEAVVDTGAWTMVINEEIRGKLGLRDKGYREATRVNVANKDGDVDDADGQKGEYPMAGPLEVWWKNRHMVCEALVLPDAPDVLLGAMALEHMDLMVDPKGERLIGVHGDREMHRV